MSRQLAATVIHTDEAQLDRGEKYKALSGAGQKLSTLSITEINI